jgi:hypothetical protein
MTFAWTACQARRAPDAILTTESVWFVWMLLVIGRLNKVVRWLESVVRLVRGSILNSAWGSELQSTQAPIVMPGGAGGPMRVKDVVLAAGEIQHRKEVVTAVHTRKRHDEAGT